MPLLDWIKKAQAVKVADQTPYHLLDFKSVHGDPACENLLVQGDNLLALKALLPLYRGKVKCIFIDPPYNTQSAFEHYDDKLEHSQWLSMMYPRLVLLRELLAEEGSIWVTIDDNEGHYLKVLMDEVFGRENFVATIAWQKKVSPANDAIYFSGDHDHVLVFAKRRDIWRPNRLKRDTRQLGYYKNVDEDPRGPWNSTAYTCAKSADERPNLFYSITNPNTGADIWPSRSRVWAFGRETHAANVADNLVYWGKDGKGTMPRFKKLLEGARPVVPRSVWTYDETGHTQEAALEGASLFGDGRFGTPKPERLLRRVLDVASNPGDLVLDSYLGSGTTAAVAHKMGRRWIGIEMGTHAVTHCLPRLEKVIAGEQGGISEAVGWKGGGGFRFFTLGEPVFDADGAINPNVGFASLATYVWHFETGLAASGIFATPYLGTHEGTAYYLLYNGILGDKRPQGGNVLTSAVLAHLDAAHPHVGPRVIYGELTRLGEARLQDLGITFKQLPYDVKAR